VSNVIDQQEMKPAAKSSSISNSPVGKIIVVDDEPELKNILVESLSAQGFEVTGCSNGRQALEELHQKEFDVLLTDLMMPEMDGIELLETALKVDPHLLGIMMTGQGTIQTAVDAMKLGAFDYVLKPFRLQLLMPVLTRAINTRRLRMENLQLRETVAIYSLCQTIAFTLEPQTVLSKLADAALQQSDADEVSILLPTSDGTELYVAAVRGHKRERLLGERIPLQQSISSWVARERVPLILNGEVDDERFVALWPRSDIRSAVSVPMQVANKLVGVINLNVTNRLRPFTLGQMKALTILASTAAAALESASLYAQLQQAEKNYRSIFENAVEGIFQSTPEGRFIKMNPAMAQILAYDSPEEAIEQITDIAQQIYVEPAVRSELDRLQKDQGILQSYEVEAYRKNGEKIWLSLNRRTIRDNEGIEICHEGSVEDITKRKRAELALRESEGRYRDLVENAHDIIYEHDLQGNYISSNKAGELITGYTAEETLQLNLAQMVAPEFLEKSYQMFRSKIAGEKTTAYELEIISKQGKRVAVEVNNSLVYHNGSAVAVQGIARDVTERKLLEEQLRQSQKLEAIGQLAGGVAHDFNNLLTVIGGYSSILLGKLPKDSPHRSSIEEIKKASDRASVLTRQLLAFSRKQILQPKILDLNLVVADMEKMVRRLIGEDIDLLTITSPVLGKVKADPGQIEQVLLNLIVNARDAMPKGGKLTIETRNVVHSAEYGLRHAAQAGPYVMLVVSDTGCGMDAAIQPRVFEPFFTTKGSGKGTGLGLATVYGIVKQSGGNIWVYSEVGRGTTFKISLPRVDEVNEDEDEIIPSAIPKGTELVLLVEDEEQVRTILQEILDGLGYRVLAASNGEEALLISEDFEHDIKLMITDVVMPHMSGRELAERVQLLRPTLPVLFMSGYTDDAIVRHGLLDEKLHFIQKPFDSATVARKVRAVLDSPAS
jgi:PAS domain S-box-containing protein